MPNLITQYLIEMNQIDDSISHKLKRIQSQENFRKTTMRLFDSLTKREVEIVSFKIKYNYYQSIGNYEYKRSGKVWRTPN